MSRRLGYVLPLLMWFLLVGALIAALGVHVYRLRVAAQADAARDELKIVARHVGDRVDAWLGDRVDNVESMARSPAVLAALKRASGEGDDSSADAHVATLNAELGARADGALDRIALWAVAETQEGRIVASSQPDLIGRRADEASKMVASTTIHPAHRSTIFQGPAFTIVAPTPPRVGATPGAVVGWIGLPALSRLFTAQDAADPVAQSYITDSSGRYLTRLPGDAATRILEGRATGPALGFCLVGGSGEVEETDAQGAPVLVAYRWLDDPGWCLFTRADQSSRAAWRAALQRTVIQIGAAVWLVTGLLTWLLMAWTQRRARRAAPAAPAPSAPDTGKSNTLAAPAAARAKASTPTRVPPKPSPADEQANLVRNEFLASVSHEIRTPMNGVLGPLALLLRSSLDDQQRELAELARTSADALLRSIHDVVDGARLDAGELELAQEPFDPKHAIEQVAESLGALATHRHVDLELTCSTELPHRVIGDATRFRQLLGHLIDNALRCCESGRLRISARAYPGWPGQEMIYLRITDGDPKVDHMQRLAKQLIESDLSAALRSGGSGLALAICHALVKKMGGRVGGDGKAGGESAVWAEIPLRLHGASSDEPAAEEVGGTPAPGARHGVRVLLVEDNSTNQHVGALMLRSLGCEVDVCGNGRQALDRIEAKDFDIIFMDCEMPVMDGLAATRALRKRDDAKRDLPVIAVTAQAMPGDRELCIDAGMNDYLSKPVLDSDFAGALRRWLPSRVPQAGPAPEGAVDGSASDADEGLAPALDPATVNRLRSLASATDPGLLEQIFSAFRHDSQELIETMGSAIETRDAGALRPAAHLLKGASGTIGARGMVTLCEQLYHQGEGDSWDAAGDLISKLRAEFVLVLEALDRAQSSPRGT
ncbi:MAG: response regulator [Xanthomonadales bacterium]|nr:response regulator [Xanthomonadales bacterium]